ncbi:MAG: hypothetical protein GKR87_08395 [Kiritimatiellae bacterium]|nr:hypothetical protein [Kiritimatiellia bacterium]
MDKKEQTRNAVILVGFGLLCLVMSFFFNIGRGKEISKTLPAKGGIIGPLKVAKDRSVYLIKVKQDVRDREWSSVTGELLDEQKKYLFGFGKQLWTESGRDAEGYWKESVTSFDLKLTVPKEGTYFLNFEVEKSPGVSSPLYVTVNKKAGSALPFFWGSIISLILGIIFYQRAKHSSLGS